MEMVSSHPTHIDVVFCTLFSVIYVLYVWMKERKSVCFSEVRFGNERDCFVRTYVCVWEREREFVCVYVSRVRVMRMEFLYVSVYVCVRVFYVCKRERVCVRE